MGLRLCSAATPHALGRASGVLVLADDRVREFGRSVREAAEGLGHLRGVRARDRTVEFRDRRIEPLPQVLRAAPPGSGLEFVWRLGILRAWHRAPKKAGVVRAIPGDLFACRRMCQAA